MKERSAVFIINPQTRAILLIHRFRAGQEYYTLPGGKIEAGETPEEACVREAKEETSLDITLKEKVAVMHNLGRTEHYFLAGSFSGEVALGGPEKEHQNAENQYHLEWVEGSQLGQINLLPTAVRQFYQQAIERHFE